MKTPLNHLLLAGASLAAILLTPQKTFGEPLPRMRQPVALVIADSGKTILVANRRSGSLSIVDTATGRAVAEHDVGQGLADLAVLKGDRRLLVVDEASRELLLLDYQDRAVRVDRKSVV